MAIIPVLESAQFICKDNPHITINEQAIPAIARELSETLKTYTPHVWREQSLHNIPVVPYDPYHRSTWETLDWLFFISTLNFSFWSDAGSVRRFAVDWNGQTWDGYYSLLAVVKRALEAGVPITSPSFYGDPAKCSDKQLRKFFAPCDDKLPRENLPLMNQRIKFLREVGGILNQHYGGSFAGFLNEWGEKYGSLRSALQLVQMVADTFPCYRDQWPYKGQVVKLWKRAQILVAETWAAFHPTDPSLPHPIFPHGIRELTMFADYRVPQLLMHYDLLIPSPSLSLKLSTKADISPGAEEEIAIRGASVLSVNLLRQEVQRLRGKESDDTSDVMLDFCLWDEAKRLERMGVEMPEAMRVRGVFY
ncbi:hypothetical protein DACRYDRAFT_103877 [Dacryopinax primogenitus]|uniref:Queuosine 5'-phosphate N-glycosylase/hydrolase n=1 Tax=Dacryopinax primogenitus (strain DJM 731) TaxID=1858805 RepID=M5G556_DACPD|nr:uncharacterized protein DACRYDRAFT_103877 [Dacryopinax primogenitus]EJU05391.1 hypothetical protein DACRYDRAFT_103877 [Dacryopinax primogenitus]